MKKSILAAIAVIGVAAIAIAAAPVPKRIKNISTTQGNNTFLPVGYNELTCDGWVHYKMVTTNTGTVATTDPMVKGSTKAPSQPISINVASGTQYLALLLDNGSPATCQVRQSSSDGQTGSFTSATFTGDLTSGGVISGTFDGGTAIFGALSSTGSVIGTGSTQITGIKFGTVTLSSGTPSTATATVLSGMNCVCTNQTTQANPVKCAVSSTTMTATGPNTVTDVVSYYCFK